MGIWSIGYAAESFPSPYACAMSKRESCCSWALNYNSWLPLQRGREGSGENRNGFMCSESTFLGLRPYGARAEVVCV